MNWIDQTRFHNNIQLTMYWVGTNFIDCFVYKNNQFLSLREEYKQLQDQAIATVKRRNMNNICAKNKLKTLEKIYKKIDCSCVRTW